MRLVLPYHWRQTGVLKVNARERRLLPDRPARAYLQFHDQNGETFPVWLNNDTGYLHGLKEWYASYLVPAGGIFYLQRSPGSHYNFKLRVKEAAATPSTVGTTSARSTPTPTSKRIACTTWRRCAPRSKRPRRRSRT